MTNRKTFTAKIALLSAMLALPVYSVAGPQQDMEDKVENAKHEMKHEASDAKSEAKDAWREGKLETVLLFNRHLNNFTIDVDVDGTTATLSGKVESAVDKELAEQVALSVDGIKRVKNDLEIAPSDEARKTANDESRTFTNKVEDATLTAEVKMKLLANGETGGLSINVDTVNRTVTLSGKVDSSAERALAEQVAANVNGVESVDNKLKVENS